jgi:flagellin-like protein
MNKVNLRIKNDKKGITPVIATIILIAGTLVLALVVGAYTFGLFGSNVKTLQETSATLYSGATGSLVFSLNNPGAATKLSTVTLSNSTDTSISTTTTLPLAISAGVASYTLAYGILDSGVTYNYVMTFANGQSVSGSLIAQ